MQPSDVSGSPSPMRPEGRRVALRLEEGAKDGVGGDGCLSPKVVEDLDALEALRIFVGDPADPLLPQEVGDLDHRADWRMVGSHAGREAVVLVVAGVAEIERLGIGVVASPVSRFPQRPVVLAPER